MNVEFIILVDYNIFLFELPKTRWNQKKNAGD